jgi:hypothetical protein
MSEARRREAIVRMATDPAFAERLRTDPRGAAAEFGLDDDDLAVLGALGEDAGGDSAVKLSQRLSKSSLFFGGAAHALEHQTGEHGTQSEFGVLKCDGRAALIKCNGEPGLLCNLVDPGNEHAGLQCNLVVPSNEHAGLQCDLVAPSGSIHSTDGLQRADGLQPATGVPSHEIGGVLGCNSVAGVLKCNGIVVHPTGGDGGPSADGGDGGDGLRPIVVPPGGITAEGDPQVDGSVAGVLLCNGMVAHPTTGDGDGSVAGVLLCNGIVVHPTGGDGGPSADGGDGGDGLRPIVVPPGGVSEIDELGAKE